MSKKNNPKKIYNSNAERTAAYRQRQLDEQNMVRLNIFIKKRAKQQFMKLPGKNADERLKLLLDNYKLKARR